MARFKIIQYNVRIDPKYDQINKQSQQLITRYAAMHQYNFYKEQVGVQKIKQMYGGSSVKQIFKYKIFFIKQMLDKSNQDYLVFIDNDAFINKPQIKFEDMIDDTHQLFLSRGNGMFDQNKLFKDLIKRLNKLDKNRLLHEYISQSIIDQSLFCQFQTLSYGSIMFNEGFIIIKNTQNMKQFFKDAVKLMDLYLLHTVGRSCMTEDGRVIAYMVRHQKYNKLYTYLPDYAQNGVLHWERTRFNPETSFLMHNYGDYFTLDKKMHYLKYAKNSHWWNETV